MAIAYTKTWSFGSNAHAYNGDPAYDDYIFYRRANYHVKDAFVQAGWTVEGSHNGDGTLNNNNQVDSWTSAQAVDRVSNDVWVHLKSPGVGTYEIIVGVGYSAANTNASAIRILLSPSAGFGSVNGGADGTTTAAPTATDQYDLYSYTASNTTIGLHSYGVYVAASTDGKNTRLMMKQGNEISWWVGLETVDDPRSDLDGGRAWTVRTLVGGPTPVENEMDDVYNTTALYYGDVSGTRRTFYIGAQGYASSLSQLLLRAENNGQFPVTPVDLYNNTTAEKGYMGTIPDLYWGLEGHYSVGLGDSVGGPIKWFSGGTIITPWDENEPLPKVH